MPQLYNPFKRSAAKEGRRDSEAPLEDAVQHKPFLQAAMPVFACGAGLFSDGYINNV
jgi:hypothetical protein